MKRSFFIWFAAVAALALFAIVFMRTLAGAPERQPNHQTQSAATAPEAKVNEENGQAVIHLAPKVQQHLGIAEAPIYAARERKQMTLPAVVLPVLNLASMVSAYEAANAQLQKAEITARVAKREYQRLENLYSDRQNVSQRAVQAAAGVYRNDKVDVYLARENVPLAAAAVMQNWGAVITGWMGHDTNSLQRVLRRQDVLVEMTLPLGASSRAPSSVEFNLPAGGRAYARFVSAFPQVDPRVQGVGYLYITRARPGLAPGLDLVAHFGVGALRNGVIVPSSAVVWLHGEAWAYVVTGPGRFMRRQVPTSVSVPGGWFVTHGFQRGSPVVTQGAEQVLGVELTSRQPSLGTEKGND